MSVPYPFCARMGHPRAKEEPLAYARGSDKARIMPHGGGIRKLE